MAFQPGQSGNPAGRPKGSKNKSTAVKELMDDAAPEIVQRAIDMSREGSVEMTKELVRRAIQSAPDVFNDVRLNLRGKTLVEQIEVVVEGLDEGEISFNVAERWIHIFSIKAKIIESTELAPRIKELEEKLKKLGLDKVI